MQWHVINTSFPVIVQERPIRALCHLHTYETITEPLRHHREKDTPGRKAGDAGILNWLSPISDRCCSRVESGDEIYLKGLYPRRICLAHLLGRHGDMLDFRDEELELSAYHRGSRIPPSPFPCDIFPCTL